MHSRKNKLDLSKVRDLVKSREKEEAQLHLELEKQTKAIEIEKQRLEKEERKIKMKRPSRLYEEIAESLKITQTAPMVISPFASTFE